MNIILLLYNKSDILDFDFNYFVDSQEEKKRKMLELLCFVKIFNLETQKLSFFCFCFFFFTKSVEYFSV